MSRNYYVGLDLGQKGDYTAIAVVEEWEEAVGGVDRVTYEPKTTRRLDVRHLERVPLGTPYPEVVERVCDLVRSPELKGRCCWWWTQREWAVRWWTCCGVHRWRRRWRR